MCKLVFIAVFVCVSMPIHALITAGFEHAVCLHIGRVERPAAAAEARQEAGFGQKRKAAPSPSGDTGQGRVQLF